MEPRVMRRLQSPGIGPAERLFQQGTVNVITVHASLQFIDKENKMPEF